jgi:hypothetical protein
MSIERISKKTGFDPFSEVLVLLINLLSLRVYPGCLGHVNGPSVIFKVIYQHWFGLGDVNSLLLHLLEEIHHYNCDVETLQETNVLTLRSGENHFGLQLGGPDDGGTAGIADAVPGLGLGSEGIIHGIPLGPVAHKVTVSQQELQRSWRG